MRAEFNACAQNSESYVNSVDARNAENGTLAVADGVLKIHWKYIENMCGVLKIDLPLRGFMTFCR